MDRVDKDLWFTEFGLTQDGIITRGSNGAHNFKSQKCNLDIRKHFWSQRVITEWNNLPSAIKLRSSVSSFKVALDSFKAGTYKEAPASNAPRKLVNH